MAEHGPERCHTSVAWLMTNGGCRAFEMLVSTEACNLLSCSSCLTCATCNSLILSACRRMAVCRAEISLLCLASVCDAAGPTTGSMIDLMVLSRYSDVRAVSGASAMYFKTTCDDHRASNIIMAVGIPNDARKRDPEILNT